MTESPIGPPADLAALLPRRSGPGGMVVAVRRGGAVHTWGRGDLPDGPSSLFEIGSVTKTVTATLLALLAAEGVVGLDDPVAAHLPVAPPVVVRPVTLSDLASHHSGFPRLPAGSLWRGMTSERHDPYASFDEQRLLRAVAETKPERPPGEKFGYSNYGAGLLGFALARAAGTSYAALVADRVTGPLGLADTVLEPSAEQAARTAPGHGWLGRPAGAWDLAELAGAGGLRSTAADLLRLLALHGPDPAGPPDLVAAAAETARQRHQVGRIGVGLGWMIVPAGGPARTRLAHDALFHDGGTGGYRSFAAVVPATGDAVVVLRSRARGVTGTGLRLLRALAA
ncbi:serine hydrolase domain-containing protein [Nocardioides ferulae]|uniref:serine hydrolase domain-containing protein n=1 Tax=Nocardioides ferulae TaxID=2340821 RepID=UPI000EB4E4DB|nr:serine hydrolase domain-containing protein [Nocardioides ferulae]